MKALISAFALLTFVAGAALPVETYAQTAGTGQTMAPDTSTSTTTTKKEEDPRSRTMPKRSRRNRPPLRPAEPEESIFVTA